MATVLRGLVGFDCLVYLDDVIGIYCTSRRKRPVSPRREHGAAGTSAASSPASDVAGRLTRRRRPPGHLQDYTSREGSGRTVLKEGGRKRTVGDAKKRSVIFGVCG
ncbi:hypothetical protein T05_2440 [Trichinella murrelli]|uniref:Uncharacterized protein n=1 Tax=Trichinella murrelli TaxID=144512 RepID=A0A0V0TAB5_9BILA|nr:hypothetical protein T05_2440 [Trichinella murrelli]